MFEGRFVRVTPKSLTDTMYYALIDTLYSHAFVKAKMCGGEYYQDVMAQLYSTAEKLRREADRGDTTLIRLYNTMRIKGDFITYYGTACDYIYEFNDEFIDEYFKEETPSKIVRELEDIGWALGGIRFVTFSRAVGNKELRADDDLSRFIDDTDMARSIVSVWEKRHGKDTDTGED